MPITREPYFSPTSIGGCALWLDGADQTSRGMTLSGTNVTSWNDKSGNGRHLSATSAYPTITSGGILFNGATPNVLSNATAFAATNGINGFVVFNSTVASTRQRIFMYVYTGQKIGYVPDTTFNSLYSSTVGGDGPVSYSANTTYIYGGNTYTSSPVISHSENGVETQYPSTYGTNTSSQTQLLVGGQATVYFTGTIKEVILYDAFITLTQRTQIEGYLAQKWGLQSQLPQGHLSARAILYRAVKVGTTNIPLYTQFSPTSIPGCVLWLDAADATTITLSGTNVTQMKDKSSNSYTLTGSVGTYPTRTATMNGLPVISSAAGKYLTISNFNQNFTTASCFIVMRPTEDITPLNKWSNGYPLYTFVTGIGSGAFQFGINYANETQNPGDNGRFTLSINKSGTGLLYGYLGGANRLTYNPVNTTLLMSGVLSGTTTTNFININGSSVTLGLNNAGSLPLISTVTIYCIGLPSGQSFGYEFAESIIYGSVLTATQRQTVESYLAQKWGLTASLPNPTHINFTQPAGLPPNLTLTAQRGKSYVPYQSSLFYYNIGPSYWTANWQPYLQSLTAANSSGITLTTSNITGGASFITTLGGCLAPNGNIYFGQFNGGSMLVLNPTTGVTSNLTGGATYTANGWIGGVLAQNGNIYFAPYSATSIFVLNPTTGVTSNLTGGATYTSAGWNGAVLGPNGNIYCTPHTATNILVLNPTTGVTTNLTGGANYTGGWTGGCLAPNGNIYFAPFSATNILVLNPTTGVTSNLTGGATFPGNASWIGGVLAPNGNIYFAPFSATNILVLNPTTGVTSNLTGGATFPGGGAWAGGVLAPNGNIYFTPHGATNILVLNPTTGVTTNFTGGATFPGGSSWYTGILAPNGNIYFAPRGATNILKLTFSGLSQTPSLTYCLSAYTNKY